jgi:hypothetical protein
MPKSHVLQIRLDDATLDTWRAEAKRDRTSVSAFVSECVDARCRVQATLREEDERRAHAHHMWREAARRLAEAEERRKHPRAADVLAALDEIGHTC